MRSETEKMLSEGLYSGSAWKECAERLAGMALPDDERLAFACLRFACGERDALAPEVAELNAPSLPKEAAGLLYALRLRIAGFPATGELPPAGEAALPRWVTALRRTGMDMDYPFSPVVDSLVSHEGRPVMLLRDVCPACRKESRIAVTSPLFPREDRGVWYCPHCLARREWDKGAVRQTLWSWYRAFLASQAHGEDGTLCDEAARIAVYAALALFPLAPVRFGRLFTENIGHLIQNTWLYVMYKGARLLPASLDIIGLDPEMPVANTYMAEKWGDVLELSPVGPQLYRLAEGSAAAMHEFSKANPRFYCDPASRMSRGRPAFSFSFQEQCRAGNELEKMGIPADAKFACLHVRDSGYGEQHHPKETLSWTRLRNGNIDDYRKTAQYLVERGYYVIRTGRDMEREIDWGDGIIDYASRFRSDFMDIWLFSNCDLCISTSSGPDVLSLMFSRPTVYVDYCVPLDGEFAHYDALYLPKVFFHPSGERITMRESFRMRLHRRLPEDILQSGITYRHCTPDEILAATRERLSMLDGSWHTTPQVERHQDQVTELVVSASFYPEEEKKRICGEQKAVRTWARRGRVAQVYLRADMEQEARILRAFRD